MSETDSQLCTSCRTKNLSPDIVRHKHTSGACGTPGNPIVIQYEISFGELEASALQGCPFCKGIISGRLDRDIPKALKDLRDNDGCTSQAPVEVKKSYYCASALHAFCFTHLYVDVTFHGALRSSYWESFLKRRVASTISRMPQRLKNDHRSLESQVRQCKTWLRECEKSHWNCPEYVENPLPTRVIDVSEAKFGNKVWLYRPTSGLCARYAALSYCWGGERNIKTTSDNLASHVHGIPYDSLPDTIADAVWFTRALGIQYLWIDTLCILQDSIDDKEKEIKQMRKIFKNAYVTLEAAKAKGVYEGFLSKDRCAGCDESLSHIFEVGAFEKDVEDSTVYFQFVLPYGAKGNPSYKRAWTLEERLLSRRILTFSYQGLQWQCYEKTMSHYDGLHPNPVWHRFFSPLKSREPIRERGDRGSYNDSVPDLWLQIVEDYSDRALTRPEDKLLALAGIVEEFAQLWGDQLGNYEAGLWSRHLHTGLMWHLETAQPKPSIIRAPSWSWAAVNGGVSFLREDLRLVSAYQNLSHNIGQGPKAFHKLIFRSIKLKTCYVRVRWPPERSGTYLHRLLCSRTRGTEIGSVYPDFSEAFDAQSDNIIAAFLGRVEYNPKRDKGFVEDDELRKDENVLEEDDQKNMEEALEGEKRVLGPPLETVNGYLVLIPVGPGVFNRIAFVLGSPNARIQEFGEQREIEII